MPEMEKGRRGAQGGHRLAHEENRAWARCPRCRLPYGAPLAAARGSWVCLYCGRRFARREDIPALPDWQRVLVRARGEPAGRFLWLPAVKPDDERTQT